MVFWPFPAMNDQAPKPVPQGIESRSQQGDLD